MKKQYDFSKARPNPYAKRLRAQAKRSKDPAMRALLAEVVAAEAVFAARSRERSGEAPRRSRKASRRK